MYYTDTSFIDADRAGEKQREYREILCTNAGEGQSGNLAFRTICGRSGLRHSWISVPMHLCSLTREYENIRELNKNIKGYLREYSIRITSPHEIARVLSSHSRKYKPAVSMKSHFYDARPNLNSWHRNMIRR